MSLDELKLISKEKTKIQTIRFYENKNNKLLMTLDTFAQFLEGEDEEVYHNNFIKPIKNKINRINKILIGGGGDGLLAKRLLELKPSLNINIVEIDKEIINLFKNVPRLIKLNGNSLFSCNIVIDNIKNFVRINKKRYDAVFLDLPDPNNEELKKLYKQKFLSQIPKILNKNGIFIMQSPLRYKRRIYGLVKRCIGKNARIIFYKMPWMGEGCFIYSVNKRKYCKKCGTLICLNNKSGYCKLCNAFNARKAIGKNGGNYKDGRTLKKYYCIDCNKKITFQSGYHGGGRCNSCANRLNSKKLWKDKKWREKTLKASMLGRVIKPNKPEKLLNRLLNQILPNEYKYVGNGKVILNGFNPDFVNCNGQKKIIELYGDYWHNLPIYEVRDKNRLSSYKKYGYKTLIIWEHELKNLDKVKNRIKEFNIIC